MENDKQNNIKLNDKQEKNRISDINKLPVMLLQARGFKYVFDSLNQNYIDNFLEEQNFLPNSANFISVTATNASFSCELYLKAIFVYEHRNDNAEIPKTHNLHVLFKKLSKKKKLQIINIFTKKHHYSENLFFYNLKNIADSFKNFRYLFEQENSYTLYLNFFCIFIEELDILLNDIMNHHHFSENIEFHSNDIEITKKLD